MLRSSRSDVIAYLLAESGLFIFFTYLLIIAGTSNGVVNYDLVRFGIGVLIVVGAAWLLLRRGLPAPAPLSFPIVLFLSVYLLAALASIDPRRSAGEVWLAGAAVIMFTAAADLVGRGWPREVFVKALLLAGTILLALGWYTAFGWYERWLAVAPGEWLPAITFRLPSPNTLAIVLNLLSMPALARIFATQARLPRLLLIGWLTAALGLIYLTSSRGGWLGTIAGVGAVLFLSLPQPGAWPRQIRDALRTTRRVVIAGGLVAALGAAALLGVAAYRQLTHPTHGPALSSRAEFWGPAWQAFLASPWLGQGPYTYASAYLRANSVPPSIGYTHAHSVPLNLLAETGVFGLAAFGVLGAAALLALRWRLRQVAAEDRGVVVGALAALTAYSVHGFVETVSVEPVCPFIVAILAGAALGSRQDPSPGLRARWPALLWLALAAVGLYGVWLSTPLHAGAVAANRLDWPQAAAHLAEAARRDARSAVAHQQAALAESVLAAQGGSGALDRAIASLKKAVALDPDWALNHANLGALYVTRGDLASGLVELRLATALAPGEPLYFLNLGLAAEFAGRPAEAEAAYGRALILRPAWAGAYFWRASPARAAVLARWRQANPQPAEPGLAELEAAIAADPHSALPYARLAQAYLALGRNQQAAELLQKAELAHFARDEVRLEVIWLQAELAAAREDWQTAVALGEQALEGHRAPSIFGPGSLGKSGYAQFVFRREAMALEIVPQMAIIRITDLWAGRLVQLGGWLEALSDFDRAAAVYHEVLSHVPDDSLAREQLRGLEARAVDD